MRGLVDDAPRVDQVWTRGAEWGPDLARVAAALFAAGFLVWLALSAEMWTLAALFLGAGGVAALAFAYPVVITLERPVRVTPEQAAKDFYGALSHHAPHYRRMWLLLSTSGRITAYFATFEGFKNYWQGRLAGLRGPGKGRWTPLQFEVTDFTSGKSAGQEEVSATFLVQVYLRGNRVDGPIASHRVEATLVKGPDRMWYLDRGTLPA